MPTLSSLNTDVHVKKVNGSLEPFSPDKIITSCMNVGSSFVQASLIASEVASSAYDGMPTGEIRKAVYEKLSRIDLSMAEQYMYRLHMSVKTSKTTLEPFNVQKIADSLVRETDLDNVYADLIARDVEKELGKMHLKHVTAPLIREIVNVKLLERGFESARARYTRLGMPVYDVKNLLERSQKINNGLLFNPETVHKMMADQISREYTLLSVLPNELADAHMGGRLHIHDLDYFSVRLMGFCHDLRFFLKNGLRPSGLDDSTAVSGPAKNPEVAFLHAVKVLAASQTNCSGGQALSYFNVYLAPYVRRLPYTKVRQLVQMFVYELGQMYASRGGQMVYSSIDLYPGIPPVLFDVPAVQPDGLIDGTTYGSFGEESLMLLDAVIEVCSKGDYRGRAFNFPKVNIHLPREVLKKPVMERILSLAVRRRTLYFIADRAYLPQALSYHSCSYLMPAVQDNPSEFMMRSYARGGCMQAVTLNLPQIAYEVKGNDDQLFELLEFWIKRARDILLLKMNLIEGNLQSGMLSFMAQKVGERERYLEPAKQNHTVSFAGLSEMVKAHTGQDYSEKQGFEFGISFIEKMQGLLKRLSESSGLNFVMAAVPFNSFSNRMARIDMANHPKALVQGGGEDVFYTDSFRPPVSLGLSMEDRMQVESVFSPLMNGGVLSSFSLDEWTPDALSFNIMKAITQTDIQYFNFV
jgi:anaerobic ribonucleoside-triphosphate reductase